MSIIGFLREIFNQNRSLDAMVWSDRTWTYDWLLKRLDHWVSKLETSGLSPGSVVSLEADFSPDGVALFLALMEQSCILVPLTSAVEKQKDEFLGVAEVGCRFLETPEGLSASATGRVPCHALYQELHRRKHPGLVLFSSGSTGRSKAAVHDLSTLLEKFKTPRRRQRTITFLLYDHIGGVNTMLYTLSNAGCMVTVPDRRPDTVLGAISRHRVDLLPTSPTFLNLILLSQAWQRHDLSSLQTVTYGTEPMPESTLRRFHELFPNLKLQQTYGLSEIGILRSKSKSSDSLWMRIGGEGFDTRIVDGMLQIKAQSAMLGYLNSPSPFTDDGWFLTGDAVEVEGEYLRVLGRRSELINVGGEKVYPAEVESVLLQMPGVEDASVVGEPHPITGNIVVARVNLAVPEPLQSFRQRMRIYCREHLAPYKVPARVELVEGEQYSARFKKMRRTSNV